MKTLTDPRAMQHEADALRRAGRRIAVVPTMGALHEGHRALMREARTRADCVIVTLFVNPSQFGAGEDFERYPRNREGDATLAQAAGVDILFAPEAASMYGPGFQTTVNVEQLSLPLEGAFRPTHFRGVATIVTKLFILTSPHCAIFGQKDAQQVVVIRRLIRDLDFNIELVVIPTVREPDGLALSSRNTYLTPAQRREAPVLYASLRQAEAMIGSGERSGEAIVRSIREMISTGSGGRIDYCSVADGETLQELRQIPPGITVLVSLAVRFGTTRLIDNILISSGPGVPAGGRLPT
jgi:pantoate--beta-alanine ligase